jgi:myosin heavy subunit
LVEYDTDGFVEKNRDELPRETTDLLLSSSSSFVKELASIISSAAATDASKSARVGPKKSVTVGGHFSKQLTELRAKIDLTSPHYVRCLKPNGLLVPDHFDPLMIVEQLRCAGVVEAVRVSRVGYPQRYNHSQFVARYRTLGLDEMKKAAKLRKVKPVEALVNAIAMKMAAIEARSQQDTSDDKTKLATDTVDLLEVGIQVGKTKVFLRRRAFDVLEKMRKDYMATAAIKIQSTTRRYIEQRAYKSTIASALVVQCWSRMIIARQKVQAVREYTNAQRIQSVHRRIVARRQFICVQVIVRWCQRFQRGSVGRARYNQLNQIRKATVIASYWRALPHRRWYVKFKASALAVQCAVRCRRSRLMLKELKANAKSLQNVAQERDQLREKMEEMRLELERTKLQAQKEAEEAAKIREVANVSNESDMTILQEEVCILKDQVTEMRLELENEKHRTTDALAKAQSAQNELIQSQALTKEIQSKLDSSLSNVKAKDDEIKSLQDQLDRSSSGNQMAEKLQLKLDDALDECCRKDNDIQLLKSQLEAAQNASLPQSPQQDENDQIEPLVSLAQYQLLQREIKLLQEQLDSSTKNGAVEYTSLSHASEMQQLKDENERLRGELNQATSIASNSHETDLDEERERKEKSKLKREVSKLKEANKKILETAEEQYAALMSLEQGRYCC